MLFVSITHICFQDDYYNPGFGFCQPEGGPKKEPESLGSILFGDRIFNSPYDVSPVFHACNALKPSAKSRLRFT